ncbi:hypothetical protein DFH11DRAFT_1598045 [Phellopilus nigrolimitatus]|nr:hypothetical protein DFH11DRAFT_1598045 [Phellopilus nigrolimitatus]
MTTGGMCASDVLRKICFYFADGGSPSCEMWLAARRLHASRVSSAITLERFSLHQSYIRRRSRPPKQRIYIHVCAAEVAFQTSKQSARHKSWFLRQSWRASSSKQICRTSISHSKAFLSSITDGRSTACRMWLSAPKSKALLASGITGETLLPPPELYLHRRSSPTRASRPRCPDDTPESTAHTCVQFQRKKNHSLYTTEQSLSYNSSYFHYAHSYNARPF